ncbi:UDP-glucose 4-epimerase [Planifilum fimeticola]|jgi:UDP-glucose 4-epimerase|uniref:UDP-glucose 4-epimerase n=1 Tax=Planifilum fimeticola TaxID=201975 RepID=A0A2T0LHW4_9BACL|nr:SDR family oxidoreductase [Planifilum fimeticola]PRX41987.1 UDP-glucose 4-epimerase [Planifilum fimeticola]
MKVMVTGGAGFIGSHIVDRLIDLGHEVIILDNLSTGKKAFIHPEASFYQTDLRDRRIGEILEAERPEAVIHQAAQIDVPTSVKDPLFDAETNILGTLRLLEACRRSGVRKIVYASSAAVYGEPAFLPIDEEHPVDPLSNYGISKYTPESYLKVYKQLYGLDYTILRYANVYGIRQDPRGEGGVIAIFLDRVLREEALTIFGDGKQTRDFVYVGDIADANIRALHRGSGMIFNLGTGVPTSLEELVRILMEVTEKEIRVEYGPERPGDIKHSHFDNRLAGKWLDWTPRIDLKTGLRMTYEYYLEAAQRLS